MLLHSTELPEIKMLMIPRVKRIHSDWKSHAIPGVKCKLQKTMALYCM
jgi:hypothetical protein